MVWSRCAPAVTLPAPTQALPTPLWVSALAFLGAREVVRVARLAPGPWSEAARDPRVFPVLTSRDITARPFLAGDLHHMEHLTVLRLGTPPQPDLLLRDAHRLTSLRAHARYCQQVAPLLQGRLRTLELHAGGWGEEKQLTALEGLGVLSQLRRAAILAHGRLSGFDRALARWVHLEELTLSGEALESLGGGGLTRCAPQLQALRIETTKKSLSLRGVGGLSRLQKLSIVYKVDRCRCLESACRQRVEEIRDFDERAATTLVALRELDLREVDRDVVWHPSLSTAAGHLAALRTLRVDRLSGGRGSADLRAAVREVLPRLECMEAAEAEELLGCKSSRSAPRRPLDGVGVGPRLRDLTLSETDDFYHDQAVRLVRAFPNISRLRMKAYEVDGAAIRELEQLAGLKELGVSANFGREEVAAFVGLLRALKALVAVDADLGLQWESREESLQALLAFVVSLSRQSSSIRRLYLGRMNGTGLDQLLSAANALSLLRGIDCRVSVAISL